MVTACNHDDSPVYKVKTPVSLKPIGGKQREVGKDYNKSSVSSFKTESTSLC